ncbi:MAG: SocA family protein [Endomicrobium sp.]|jgi:uncharacterized phage-associated protein|nr:SocA family protein [Endomicrobium sp.]
MLSIRKILQALYYIQSKSSSEDSKYNIMYLLKLLYFSDRYHLRHFGFIASEDKYCAMKKGPVALATFNILKGNFPSSANSVEISLINESVPISEYDCQINKQGEDELFESFKESLDFSIKTFGKFDQFKLSEISHIYPEWKKHEKRLETGPKKSIVMNPVDFFDDPDPNSINNFKKLSIKEDPFKEPDKKFLKLLRKDFKNLIKNS